jgi:hypothetical protein
MLRHLILHHKFHDTEINNLKQWDGSTTRETTY